MVLKKAAFIVLAALILLLLPLLSHSEVMINEILANGVTDPDSEWIELYNNESFEVNLTNWKISETLSSNFTLDGFIPANGFVVLAADFATFNSTYPNVNQSGIRIINITISNFNLADTSGEVKLYNSSGALVDAISYVQASGKAFENISIGRYPDGSTSIFNLSTLTPGAKNDNQAPKLKWLSPSKNNTKISGIANITANITDDTTNISTALINFNNTNYSMPETNGMFYFLWNTSLNLQKSYNITIFFNDSYGKASFDTLFNITVNNSPFIVSFTPSNLSLTIEENSILSFSVNASDPDDALLDYFWFVDNALRSNNASFSYNAGFNDNGTHAVNATIKDASLNQVSVKWNVIVRNVNRAPVLELIPNKTASKNIDLIFNISANDLDNDALIFSSNHSEIKILKINDSLATVSWKPTNKDLGNNTINFTVYDGFLIDSKIILVMVNFTNNTAPSIISAPKTTAKRNERYVYDADAIDADNDTLKFSLKANASGMSIGSSNGIISFTPISIGIFFVNVSATDFIETVYQAYNLTVVEGSKLKIGDVDVKIDGKRSSNLDNNTRIGKEAKPDSDIEFKVTIKNDFPESENIEIEDIGVKVIIEGIDDGDDLEEESKDFNLNAGNDKTATLKFKIPLNVDEGTFDVVIEAEGEDENGNMHEQNFRLELEIEKEKHDLRFASFEIRPFIVNCNRVLDASYKIINVGQEDENAVLEIKNNEIGIDFADEEIFVESGTDDNIFTKLFRIKVKEDIKNGVYPLMANVYSDDKLLDTATAEINVNECIKTKEAKEEVLLLLPQPAKTKSVKEPLKAEPIKAAYSETDRNLRLLVLSTSIFAAFFVFTAIVLYVRF